MLHWMTSGRLIAGVACSLLLTGCGGVDRPQLATVKGKVTLNGQPVPLAKVYFAPVDGGQSSSGETAVNGEYELYFRYDEPGAQVGKHRVTVSTYQPPEVDDMGKPIGGVPEKIPAQYNTNSTLEKEVKPGENIIDLNL